METALRDTPSEPTYAAEATRTVMEIIVAAPQHKGGGRASAGVLA